MLVPIQTILLPVVEQLSPSTLAYAEMLAKAYNKTISLIFFDRQLYDHHQSEYFSSYSNESVSAGVNRAVNAQDAVMVLWTTPRSRRQIQAYLSASRMWRIPYFFIPPELNLIALNTLLLPISFLIEDREKGVWAKSLHRVFDPEIVIALANDKGTRARTNSEHIASFLQKNKIPYALTDAAKSSFKLDNEIVSAANKPSDLVVITASRDYGLDDYLLGPKERHLIRKSRVPLMILNPRGDLYVLCGD